MSTDYSSLEEQEVVNMIIKKATEDEGFRKSLLANPKKAIKDEFDVELPKKLSVKFVEKEKNVDAMYVLPDLIDSDLEISEEELEAVAGGCCWDSCTYTCGYGTSACGGAPATF